MIYLLCSKLKACVVTASLYYFKNVGLESLPW